MRTIHSMALTALATLGLAGATITLAQAPAPVAPPPPPAPGMDPPPPPGMHGGPPGHQGMHGRMHGGMRGGMREGPGPLGAMLSGRMAAELGLTDDQKQKIRALAEGARPAMSEMAEKMRASRQALGRLSPEDPGWSKAVDESSRIAGEAAARRVREGARLRAEAWKILTPEQRQKLAALQAQREQRMQEWREKRRERASGEGHQGGGHERRR